MDISTQHKNSEIKFEVKYRNRKTLAIRIEPPGRILVLSPFGLSEDQIKRKVSSKENWIIKKLVHLKNIQNIRQAHELNSGSKLMYLGNYHPVIMNYNQEFKWLKVKFSGEAFFVDTPTRDVELLKKLMEKWYRKDAEKIILQRFERHKHKYKTEPVIIKVKEQKRRWGTCTSKGNLYFNWRLIMAPLHVIDYVIIHEMSHLAHHNHSLLFWKHVSSIMPDYKKSKKWLKENGLLLDL